MASRTASKISHGVYEAIGTQPLPSDLAYLQSPHPHPYTSSSALRSTKRQLGPHCSLFPGPQGGDFGQKPPGQGPGAPGCPAVSGCPPTPTPQLLPSAPFPGVGLTPDRRPGIRMGPPLSFMGSPTLGNNKYDLVCYLPGLPLWLGK